MREILFRGFHPCKNGTSSIYIDGQEVVGEWVYGDFCKPCNIVYSKYGYDEILKKENDIYYDDDVIPETVGQFTGLCDKNGKKIFEGDILKYVDCVDRDKCFCEVVEFINGVFRSANNTDSHILGFAYCSCSEVIGDIHSNPELLEGDFDVR